MALAGWESRRCPKCGNYESLVRQGKTSSTVTTPDGRVFEVEIWRCLPCGLEEMAHRQWTEAHKDDKPNEFGALAADGLLFVTQPKSEEAR